MTPFRLHYQIRDFFRYVYLYTKLDPWWGSDFLSAWSLLGWPKREVV